MLIAPDAPAPNDMQKIEPLDNTNKKLETDQLKNINSQTNANRVKSSKETSTVLKEKKISKNLLN